jgi:hypothetical protein
MSLYICSDDYYQQCTEEKKLVLYKKARGPENLCFFLSMSKKKPFVCEISNFFTADLYIFCCCPYSAGYRVNENFLLSYQSIK